MQKILKKSFILFLLTALFAFNLSAKAKRKPKTPEQIAAAAKKMGEQVAVGTVDLYMAHGKEVYRFVPSGENKELRMVKFVPAQLGYRKTGIPEEYETILATALAEKKAVYFKCALFDHGKGKTAIGKKIVILKFADDASVEHESDTVDFGPKEEESVEE